MAGVSPRAEKAMRPYLLDHERIVVAVHQHWMRIVGILTATIVGLILALAITVVTPGNAGRLVVYSWWVWFVLVAYFLFQLILWRYDWFVVTDKRLVLTYGIVARKIAMMPMAKVTDMSFNQSVVARFMRYGTYVMESAGQEQALRQIDYIPDAAAYYRLICGQIFGEDDADHEDDNDTRHHQRHRPSDFRDDTDPYGIPSPPYDVAESSQQHQVEDPPRPVQNRRLPTAYGPNRGRVIRAATVVPPDDDPSWSVSHEDVSPPQQIRPRRDPRAGDDRA